MTDVDLTAWCEQTAAAFRRLEATPAAPLGQPRDTALVAHVIARLCDPGVDGSGDVVELVDRHRVSVVAR